MGTAPRQVVFSPDGSRAYVTTSDGVYVINTATSTVVRVIRDLDGPAGDRHSPDGSTLYVTRPDAGTLWQINTTTGRVYRCGQRRSRAVFRHDHAERLDGLRGRRELQPG